MTAFLRQLRAEALKLRRSPALRVLWLVPLLFLLVEFLVFERPLLGMQVLTPESRNTLGILQPKLVVALWGGFFHPLVLALLPALVFRPEHRSKTWRHLHAQPAPRRGIFMAKAVLVLLLVAALLAALGLMLFAERKLLGWVNPLLAQPYAGLTMTKLYAWLWLASLPLLALYLWVADRINSLAVPVVFGLVGLILSITLTGEELPQAWRRDLIPWVLPYAATERFVHKGVTQQEAHLAGKAFQKEPNVLRMPSGKKIKTWQNIPDEVLFPPPQPTPIWLLGAFSAGAGLLLLVLGWADAKRNRT